MDMYKTLGLRCDRHDGNYGVEIEVEGKAIPNFLQSIDANQLWNIELDGSLRGDGAREFVMRKPRDLDGTMNSLQTLEDEFRKAGSKISAGSRAGVHVHMNVQNYTPMELMTFATVYYMLENYLVHWAGPTRVGNHFCLRMTDAEDLIYNLIKVCETKDWRYMNTNNVRYAALNWNALHKYGSVEFRAMRSSPNMADIIGWVLLIDRVAEGAKKFHHPSEVINSMSEFMQADRFVENIMGDFAPELLKYSDKVNIWESLEAVQPLAFMVNWERFNKRKVNPFPVGNH